MIQSPNFPSAYPASKQCIYVIALDPGKAVRLDFLNFDVEDATTCLYDFVEVYFLYIFLLCNKRSIIFADHLLDSRWRHKQFNAYWEILRPSVPNSSSDHQYSQLLVD